MTHQFAATERTAHALLGDRTACGRSTDNMLRFRDAAAFHGGPRRRLCRQCFARSWWTTAAANSAFDPTTDQLVDARSEED